ncbi:EamA family transporter [Naasia aerilata]|uniref:Membrane protein n=1 Tax=Naasia aerilata TaxID=1162966 RepID=A0ABM8GF80_9MICO|nr:EamA family transporter [Naasia aerilata]BDZ47016.1 membrane protein [Naasia aerilata]
MTASPAPRRSRLAIAGPIVSALSVQAGAGVGTLLLPAVGAVGVVGLRQLFAAIVLAPTLRRDVLRWRLVWPSLCLGLALVVMNLAIYESFSRLELGLAVTLEFLGPLAVALLSSRRLLDLICGVAAGAGVALLTGTVHDIDPIGVGLALLAGVAWAAYILFTQRAGERLPGIQGTAVASCAASLVTLPLLIGILVRVPTDRLLGILSLGAVVGVLSSALPYSLDLAVLRRISRNLFSVLQSLHPAAAALSGLLILGQTLALPQLVGLAVISAANAVAVLGSARRGAAARRVAAAAAAPGA